MRFIVYFIFSEEEEISYRFKKLSSNFDLENYELEFPEKTFAFVISNFKSEEELKESLWYFKLNKLIEFPKTLLKDNPIYFAGKKIKLKGMECVLNEECGLIFPILDSSMKVYELS